MVLPSAQPTEHAMLVVWGPFAQEIGLLQHLGQVPIPQKTIIHSPVAKLTILFMGLLSGIEHLRDLSHAPAPRYHAPALASAWGLAALPEASGVSRTRAAATPQSLVALQQQLGLASDPFLPRAVADLRSRDQPLLLDADLTGRPLSDSSSSYPDAAFGYMDGETRFGYQLAQVGRQTKLYGRQWRVGQQHPGATVSAPTLRGLVCEAERRLGTPPRRQPELLAGRIAAAAAAAAAWQARAEQHQAAAEACLAREQSLLAPIAPAEERLYQIRRKPAAAAAASLKRIRQ